MIHSAFLQTVKTTPNAVALHDAGHDYSYLEVYEAACRVAKKLDGHYGEDCSRPIAIFGCKGAEALFAILGTLLSGRTYCYLQHDQGEGRLRFMFEELKPAATLIVTNHQVPLACQTGDILSADADDICVGEYKVADRYCSQVAYVMFTSGSTGRPKGICVKHSAAVWAQEQFLDHIPLSENDVVGSEEPFTFDVSTFDIFATFAVGARLVLIPEEYSQQPLKLSKFIAAHAITSIFLVPTMVQLLNSALANNGLITLKQVLLTGELISPRVCEVLNSCMKQGVRVYNLYGATEFPWGLARRLTLHDKLSANAFNCINSGCELTFNNQSADFFPLDENERLIVMVNPGLSVGSPQDYSDFRENLCQPKQYLTGDFCVRINKEDDQFILLGRKDRHIRLRGFRVELDEIEYWLERHPNVLLGYSKFSSGNILAFIVPKNKSVQQNELLDDVESYLVENLPEYMRPSEYYIIQTPTLTINGKKDRKQLELEI